MVADCVSPRAVVEVDFASKYHEGIGQAIAYGRLADLEPVLVLIVESPGDCGYVHDARWVARQSNQRMQIVTTGEACTE